MYYFELKADHGVEGMKTLVVGLFDSERLALEASGLLYSSGLSKLDMVVISRDSSRHDAEYVRGYSPSSMVMRQAFKWSVIGSVATLLATIGAVVPTVDAFWMQIFLIVSTWKIGALVGAFIGLYLGLSSSFPDTLPDWASQHLPQRNSIVAVKSRGDNLPEVRGILIESAASECREWTTKRDIYDLKLT